MAEGVADILTCPYEACRIRAVHDPTYESGMMATCKTNGEWNGRCVLHVWSQERKKVSK